MGISDRMCREDFDMVEDDNSWLGACQWEVCLGWFGGAVFEKAR